MNARHTFPFVLLLIACIAPAIALHAQAPATLASDGSKMPPLPVLKSPVEAFRDLLAMSSIARDKYLENRPLENRRRILEKLTEYATMKPEERELRLRATEVRWYVLSLVQTPAGGRATQLATVPEADRKLVGDLVHDWDAMPSDEQKELLKYEKTMEQLADRHVDAAATNIVSRVPTPTRSDASQNLDEFLQLPPGQRQQMFASFQRFFELSEVEKQKTLEALPDGQRSLTAGTLQALDKMSPEDREQYLSAVSRFSNMTVAERRGFMKNAEQWRQLSTTERQAWRSLVKHTNKRPPMPPGFGFPPMPPGFSLQVNATNLPHPSP